MELPTLPNGATIIAINYNKGIVLAKSENDFVTWSFDTSRGLSTTQLGHYFELDNVEAEKDFDMRVKRGY